MQTLTPWQQIPVPPPATDETYRLPLAERTFAFQGLKALLGAADLSKAGDRHAGLAAADETEREAARTILGQLTLQHLYDHPLTDDQGRIDSVMRVNYDIDRRAFEQVSQLTVGEFKDWLLRAAPEQAAAIGRALTGVMAAAVAKLCDTHELVFISKKIQRPSRARTQLGNPGTLSSRLQPNHPTDDPRGLTLLVYWGLSYGGGDALIGVNPAVDTVENVSAVLTLLDRLRRHTGAPTQICVLAHIKTQLACLERGAPVEILFQSLAGTDNTLVTEFDVTVELLDAGYRTMAERGPLRGTARQFMYFETGQGSECSYGKHNGIDMTTTEALCYGLARRYDPFMVNNVTGFIGPETHLDNFEMIASNLQDHFMGKLLGLPMGMAPCYTLHSRITLDGQQMATELLAAAGANYYMDVCHNTDRMLAYFDTSGHDDQTLREVFGRSPAPEFLEWGLGRGIFQKAADGSVGRGPAWGQPRQFCASDEELAELVRATPAVHGFETAGPRITNAISRKVRSDQAQARAAISSELDLAALAACGEPRTIRTCAADKEQHLSRPDLGARLAEPSGLAAEPFAVQILISDGLSAPAVHANVPDMLPILLDAFRARRISAGQPLAARYGRVKLAEPVSERLEAELVIHLIGERPGGDALSSRSLSAYLVYRLSDADAQRQAAEFNGHTEIRFEYTVVSNIHAGGLAPPEAAALVAEKAFEILEHRAAGNRLERLLNAGARAGAQAATKIEGPTGKCGR